MEKGDKKRKKMLQALQILAANAFIEKSKDFVPYLPVRLCQQFFDRLDPENQLKLLRRGLYAPSHLVLNGAATDLDAEKIFPPSVVDLRLNDCSELTRAFFQRVLPNLTALKALCLKGPKRARRIVLPPRLEEFSCTSFNVDEIAVVVQDNSLTHVCMTRGSLHTLTECSFLTRLCLEL